MLRDEYLITIRYGMKEKEKKKGKDLLSQVFDQLLILTGDEFYKVLGLPCSNFFFLLLLISSAILWVLHSLVLLILRSFNLQLCFSHSLICYIHII